MRTVHVIVLSMIAFALIAATSYAEEVKMTPQVNDPVNGVAIISYYFVDHAGFRVFFSTVPSIEAFNKDPETYMKKMADEHIAPMKTPVMQTKCPITGSDINKDLFVDYSGSRIYFCCDKCPAEFNKDPAKYVKQMTDAGITLYATPKPQATCPVMGSKITDKKLFVDHWIYRVYFCCGMCPDQFKKDPDKYMRKMAAEGYTLDLVPVKK
ncbi:MAG: YHS domain-containing protein [Candidatus Brocadiia bacterium]